MRRLTACTLRMARDRNGCAIAGLWEGGIVRMERVQGGWTFQIPMREIGRTNFFEFRPLAMGGKWHTAGVARTLVHCCIVAERMQAGTHVLRGASRDALGQVPALVVDWGDVKDEIAAHASVRAPD